MRALPAAGLESRELLPSSEKSDRSIEELDEEVGRSLLKERKNGRMEEREQVKREIGG